MRKFKSLTRLLMFYALSLVIMLALYYVMIFSMLKTNNQHDTQMVFEALHDEITQNATISNTEIQVILKRLFFKKKFLSFAFHVIVYRVCKIMSHCFRSCNFRGCNFPPLGFLPARGHVCGVGGRGRGGSWGS